MVVQHFGPKPSSFGGCWMVPIIVSRLKKQQILVFTYTMGGCPDKVTNCTRSWEKGDAPKDVNTFNNSYSSFFYT